MSVSTAGRKALVKVSGVGTAFTGEATTPAGDGQNYQITDVTKQVWDPQATITVLVGGTPVDPVADPYAINRLRGKICFTNVNMSRGTVTVTGTYLPLSVAAKAKSFTWTMTANNVDDTDFASAQANGGFMSRAKALMDIKGTIGRRWSTDEYFADALMADGAVIVIEFWLDVGASAPDLVVWALLAKNEDVASVDALVEETIDFEGTPDADGRVASLS